MFTLLSPFEIAINRLLPLDPSAEQRVLALQGKSITLTATQSPFSATLIFTDGRVALLPKAQQSATVQIEGPLHKIISLAFSTTESLVAEGVHIQGDHSLLLELKSLIHDLDIDWEEPLAKRVGDVAANKVGGWLREIARWSRETGAKLLDTGEHYINYDSPETARPDEVEHYLQAVDKLNADTERLSARCAKAERQMQRITTRIETKTTTPDQDSTC